MHDRETARSPAPTGTSYSEKSWMLCALRCAMLCGTNCLVRDSCEAFEPFVPGRDGRVEGLPVSISLCVVAGRATSTSLCVVAGRIEGMSASVAISRYFVALLVRSSVVACFLATSCMPPCVFGAEGSSRPDSECCPASEVPMWCACRWCT